MEYKIAEVSLPIALDRNFDYFLTPGLKVVKGIRVLVDFNAKLTVAVVTALKKSSPIQKLKPIIRVLDVSPTLSKGNLQFAKKLSKFYPYNLGEFLFMMLPSYLKNAHRLEVAYPEEKNFGKHRPQKLFIRTDTFLERYQLYKKYIADKLTTGSVLFCFAQVSHLEEAQKIIEKDFSAKIKVIHSYESEKELFRNWQNSRTSCIILGTRLSLFYYPRDLNLIIVEEENSPYYFQEEKPFYNLLQVTEILANLKKIDLIFGADYPTLYSYKLIQEQKMSLCDTEVEPKKINIVETNQYQIKSFLGPVLTSLLEKNIAANKKAAIFLNKKGFGSYVHCTACGYAYKCSRCSAYLRLSLMDNKGVCPYCNEKKELPKLCPQCKSGYLKAAGMGIEKIEAALKNTFPEIKISEWQNNVPNAQIFLSTSKILSSSHSAKPFDVGFILDADYQALHFDFEATFNVFIYLKKLANLCKEGLYVFSENPAHYLYQSLNEPWRSFYDKELTQRKKLNLPPFGLIAKIILRAKNDTRLFAAAQNLCAKFTQSGLTAYGPFKEYPFKLRAKFRYSIIIKSKSNYSLRKAIKEKIQVLRSSSIKVAAIIR